MIEAPSLSRDTTLFGNAALVSDETSCGRGDSSADEHAD